ncbi:PLP-dependent transferase [Allomesorhizobium camelthorni]|uniref:PLP-dependent transferase n=1 Tax=Allomesorhizobium camelthorni TaxID=475069 RepID=UPI00197F7B4E|nr:PLP-dependent transferase [Mesorhizobium camelthorni]
MSCRRHVFRYPLVNRRDELGGRFDFAAVDMRDLDALCAAAHVVPTGLVWIETPSIPMIRVVDIRAACRIAHEARALAAVHNTWATPVLQCPP